MRPATAGVDPRPHASQDRPRTRRRDHQSTGCADQEEPAHGDPPPGGGREPVEPPPRARQVGRGGDPHEPAQADEGAERDREGDLADLRLDRDRRDGPVGDGGRAVHVVQGGRQGSQRGRLVDVGHGDLGEARPESRDELRRGQAAPAEVEEVCVGVFDLCAEEVGPQLVYPRSGALQLRGGAPADGGRRPRQRVPVDLARGLGRHRVHHDEAGYERRRHGVAEVCHSGPGVELRAGRHVADQDPVAGPGGADRGGRSGHPRQGEQRAVDLSELDPATAELDLVVGPAQEDQALVVVADEVTAAVGAVPPQRGHRGELRAVQVRVEVARQADPTDDQLATASRPHGLPGGVDDREVPAVEGQPDPDRLLAGEAGGTRDHRGLGRSVGVPHLPVSGGESLPDLGRARLPAEDQQPDLVHRLHRPQRHQRRHGGDDVDVVGHQPGAEIHAAADQRARGRHQARAVRPGQPDLLAGGVEAHGQAGHHPVTGSERCVLEIEPRLGVDEGGRGAVGDGDALRLPGGARGEDDPCVVGEVRIRRHGP